MIFIFTWQCTIQIRSSSRPGAPPAPHSTCPKSNSWPPSLKLPFRLPYSSHWHHQHLFHMVLTLGVFFASFQVLTPSWWNPVKPGESCWPSPGWASPAPHPTFPGSLQFTASFPPASSQLPSYCPATLNPGHSSDHSIARPRISCLLIFIFPSLFITEPKLSANHLRVQNTVYIS